MKVSYYNLENDDYNKKYGRYKKKKLLTIRFKHFLETVQFENSDRGYLVWINTPKKVNVFGYWKQDGCGGSKNFYQHWTNDHCACG